MQSKKEKAVVDYCSLGLCKNMINILNNINDECTDFVKNKETMNDNIKALVSYYVEPIVKHAINLTRKKIDFDKLNKLDDRYDSIIELYKHNNIEKLMINISSKQDPIDIINSIMFYCIKLYKNAQLLEYKFDGFNTIKLNAKDNCCILCLTKSKFDNSIEELLNDIHPFCKDSYDVYVNQKDVDAFIKKTKIMCGDRIKDINIKLLSTIDFSEMIGITDDQKEKIETIKDSIVSYCHDNELLIDKHNCKDIYHTVLLNIFDFSFSEEIQNWFNDKYNDKIKDKTIFEDMVIYKNPFVSFMAEISSSNYLKESIIYYILDSDKLLAIDKDAFSFIKENVFNNLEFR